MKPALLSFISFFFFWGIFPLYSFNSKLYQKILSRYVVSGKTIDGVRLNVVDYKGLFREKRNPDSDFSRLLKQVEKFNPDSLEGRDEKVAFWINAYNIGAINLILMNYPVDSIRSMKINFFKNPWGKKAIKIQGRWYSLERIEHGILLGKYKILMAHFGIVCASVSCPELSSKVYTSKTLNSHLREQALIFFRSSYKGIRINRERKTVYVSSIFKFDSKNFSDEKKDIIPFIIPFIENNDDREYLKKMNYKTRFLPYNWNINDLKNVQ